MTRASRAILTLGRSFAAEDSVHAHPGANPYSTDGCNGPVGPGTARSAAARARRVSHPRNIRLLMALTPGRY